MKFVVIWCDVCWVLVWGESCLVISGFVGCELCLVFVRKN